MAKRILRNVGRLHHVNCDWCGLKMACSCFFDMVRDQPPQPHPLVLCPRCQVAEFLNVVHGRDQKDRGAKA